MTLQLMPNVFIVGDFMWPWYQEVCAQALETLGCKVIRFGWFESFRYWRSPLCEPVYHSIYHKIQYRFQKGPIISKINHTLIETAIQERPDIVWFYNVTIIQANTIKKLRTLLPEAIFCQYANDNPFSQSAQRGFWRHFLRSIPYFDLHFAYRHSNIALYRKFGAKQPNLLRSYFLPKEDAPIPLNKVPSSFHCDVVFAGHYEKDGRVEMLESICYAGFKLKLYGGGWNAALKELNASSPLHQYFPIAPAVGIDYQYAICGAKVALCFLSTLNKDTYTRRNFQIPAMKIAMLSQYSDDLATLFQPDVEAVFFNNKAELLEKLQNLVQNDDLRTSVAHAGYLKVYAAGHDVKARMVDWLNIVKKNSNVIN